MIKVIQNRIDEMLESEKVMMAMVVMKRNGSTTEQIRAWLVNAAICTLIGL